MLQVLVTALLDTIRKSFVNMVFLMALLIFISGILGFYLFGTGENGDQALIQGQVDVKTVYSQHCIVKMATIE